MKIDDLMTTARDAITVRRVYGEPVTVDRVTVIAAASVWGGGGGGGGRDEQGQEGQGGGFGLHARPVGAYVINDGSVRWMPAVDVNGIVGMLGAVVFTIVVSCARVARRRAKAIRKALVERELRAVVVEVLRGVVVDVGQGHHVGEERIPAGREMHPPRERGLGFRLDVMLQGRDHPVHQPAHPGAAEHARSTARSPVVDHLKWPVGRVEQPRVHAAHAVGQPSKTFHQWS
jgi:uncharacterized spore protein YtfJ